LRVFSNSAISVDGKLGTSSLDHLVIGSDEDRRLMSVLRAQADAVLVGGQTFRNWPLPLVESPSALRPEDRRSDRDGLIINAVLTRVGITSASAVAKRWPDPRVRLLVFGPPTLDVDAHRQALGAEVFTSEEPGVAWVLDELQAMGCRSVLVEGGGDLIARVLRSGRLSELFVTLAPVLIGGVSAPTLLDGAGLRADELVKLRLQSVKRVDDELFLHYTLRSGGSPG